MSPPHKTWRVTVVPISFPGLFLAVAAFCAGLNAAPARAQTGGSTPNLPYEDWGACPFECCTYREWTANAETGLKTEPRTSSREPFRVHKGEHVTGLTGVVITQKPGLVKALKDHRLDEDNPVRLRAGDVIYVLHYVGEGYWQFWFQGRTHTSELAAGKLGVAGGLHVESLPKSVWWVKVKNSRGEVGWTDKPKHFDHIDACE